MPWRRLHTEQLSICFHVPAPKQFLCSTDTAAVAPILQPWVVDTPTEDPGADDLRRPPISCLEESYINHHSIISLVSWGSGNIKPIFCDFLKVMFMKEENSHEVTKLSLDKQ